MLSYKTSIIKVKVNHSFVLSKNKKVNLVVLYNTFSSSVRTNTRSVNPKADLQTVNFDDLNYNYFSKSSVLKFLRGRYSRFREYESYYTTLLQDNRIVDYFKRFHPFAKLAQIEGYLKRSKYYNKAFFDKLAAQVSNTRKQFFENLESATSLMSTEGHVSISESEHYIGLQYIHEKVFCARTTEFKPDLDYVMNQIKWNASAGLPFPWFKKSELREQMEHVVQSLINQTFSFSTVSLTPITAAFVRSQITNEGLKVRLVFAVNYVFLSIETYFNSIIKYIMDNVSSCAVHGYTQVEISNLARTGKDKFTLCVDYSRFDQRMPTFVLASVLLYLVTLLSFNFYLQNVFIMSFCYFMSMPVFHPNLAYSDKKRGLSSGSGYTSRIGSLCNAYMLSIAVYRYCKQNNIKYDLNCFTIYISSDDTMIFSDFYIDFKKLSYIMEQAFAMRLDLESKANPGVDRTFFLGSEWIDGYPHRNVDRMLGRILYGNPNLPKMSDLMLMQSRCFEILGNTVLYSEIYDTFRIPYPSGKIYRILELSDFTQRQNLESKLSHFERRAVLEEVHLNRDNANQVWTTR